LNTLPFGIVMQTWIPLFNWLMLIWAQTRPTKRTDKSRSNFSPVCSSWAMTSNVCLQIAHLFWYPPLLVRVLLFHDDSAVQIVVFAGAHIRARGPSENLASTKTTICLQPSHSVNYTTSVCRQRRYTTVLFNNHG